MNPYRVGIFAFAILCVIAAIVIAYRKIWIPWATERAWRRDNIKAIDRMARNVAIARQQQAAAKNGRTQRTGSPINRKAGR